MINVNVSGASILEVAELEGVRLGTLLRGQDNIQVNQLDDSFRIGLFFYKVSKGGRVEDKSAGKIARILSSFFH